MFNKLYKYIFLLLFNSFIICQSDVNIMGNIYFRDGLGRLTSTLISTIKNDLNVSHIRKKDVIINFADIAPEIKKIIENNVTPSPYITILYDSPWSIYGETYKEMPDSKIKIAYSMLEASAIPQKWVEVFNNNFDAVVVPDDFLVEVYQSSGVKIPIFVLPCILLLGEFLKKPVKKTHNKPFTFGISAAYGIEKNHHIVIEAFAKEFGNNPNFKLVVHGRWGNRAHLDKMVQDLKLNNVTVVEKIFAQQEYINFLSSLDCYVLLSRGEGFSITPREALALGIPCILTNHTAHKTICKTNLIRPVKAEIKMPIYYSLFDSNCGYQLSCTVEDAQVALKEVYDNYSYYLKKAIKAREWVKQYLPVNLKQKYLNLISPKNIVFGNSNLITNNGLTTNSKSLYEKYLFIKNKKG